jgi:signal transduction histidine kinase
MASLKELLPLSGSGPEYILETVNDERGEPFRMATGYRTLGPTPYDRQFGRVGMRLRDRDAGVRRVRDMFLAGVPLAIGLSFLAAWRPWRSGRRRIAAMEADTQATVGDDTPRRRFNVPQDDPALGGLAVAFNRLLDRHESAREAQDSVLADAAHELRTPLTILQGEIDVILRKDRPAEQYREVLVSNREEIQRLARLVANLLSLARSEAGNGPIGLEVLDLVALTREVCEKLTPLAQAKRIRLICETDFPVLMSGNAVSLGDAVFNLTENAIRYSPPDESVRVRVAQAEGEIRLEVHDHGRGIPSEEIPRVFDRFYRLDGSRTESPDGVGLGLAIVKAVVNAHGGRVEVKSEIGQGAVFIVIIPQKLPEDPALAQRHSVIQEANSARPSGEGLIGSD